MSDAKPSTTSSARTADAEMIGAGDLHPVDDLEYPRNLMNFKPSTIPHLPVGNHSVILVGLRSRRMRFSFLWSDVEVVDAEFRRVLDHDALSVLCDAVTECAENADRIRVIAGLALAPAEQWSWVIWPYHGLMRHEVDRLTRFRDAVDPGHTVDVTQDGWWCADMTDHYAGTMLGASVVVDTRAVGLRPPLAMHTLLQVRWNTTPNHPERRELLSQVVSIGGAQ